MCLLSAYPNQERHFPVKILTKYLQCDKRIAKFQANIIFMIYFSFMRHKLECMLDTKILHNFNNSFKPGMICLHDQAKEIYMQ